MKTLIDKLLDQAAQKRQHAARLLREANALTDRAHDEAVTIGEYMGNGYLAERADMGIGPKSPLTY